MPKLTILVGPSGSGKSTKAYEIQNTMPYGGLVYRISQDDQGKDHLNLFKGVIKEKIQHIVIDRMNFDKKQRARYLNPAKEAGYETEIIVLHENYQTCLSRMLQRKEHPTIPEDDEKTARSALGTFFKYYERPEASEADVITFVYPEPLKHQASVIIVDIDNTLSDASHREHFLSKEGGKKPHWKGFFDAMDKDLVNKFAKNIIHVMGNSYFIVLSSGRRDSYRGITETWLAENDILYNHLFMRPRDDSRSDTIVKEIILDFEIKTRYKDILFALDDRKCVIDMLRSRGVRVLDCAGNTF